LGQRDVGHSVIATGRGALRLNSFISAGVWTLVEKLLKTASYPTYRGRRLLLKVVKWTTFIKYSIKSTQ